jgi:hypothetical protein
MKKIYPYILPTIALVIIIFLTIRWYTQRTEQSGQITPFGESIEIESITEEEANEILKGADDLQSVSMQTEKESDSDSGEIRYEVKDDKVYFSVSAQLEQIISGEYQVWLKDPNSEEVKKAFVLNYGKVGYFGSASLSKKSLPLEVIVSKELNNSDNQIETIKLSSRLTEELIEDQEQQ